jgi:hypothetical protein
MDDNKKLEAGPTFLKLLERKLIGKGFEIKHDILIVPYKVDFIAVKTSLEASKFGKMTRAITIAYLENLDIGTIQSYSMASTKYALDNRDSLLPRGFGGSLLSLPVIVSDDFKIDIKLWMEKTLAEKHWAAFEFPVLISLKDKKIYYCKKTPIWGAAYYRGFRKFVEDNFSF